MNIALPASEIQGKKQNQRATAFMNSQHSNVVLPMWRGRRGALNTIACGVLGIATAVALWMFAVRVAVAPACTAYGQRHDMTYVDYKVYGQKRRMSSACILTSPTGARHDVAFTEAASYLTDLWVGFAFSLEISIPAFILLFAVARTRMASGSRKGVPDEQRP